jgi:hypothetical protein
MHGARCALSQLTVDQVVIGPFLIPNNPWPRHFIESQKAKMRLDVALKQYR